MRTLFQNRTSISFNRSILLIANHKFLQPSLLAQALKKEETHLKIAKPIDQKTQVSGDNDLQKRN